MHDPHVGESAELYALGELSDAERAQVEAHLLTCADCRRFVGKAEEIVLALEETVRPLQTPPELDARIHFARRTVKSPPKLWLAIAAAFLLGLLPSIGMLLERGPNTSLRDTATLAMLRGHFAHAPFAGGPGAPRAKVIYAINGSWLYVVVGGRRSLEVDALRDGRVDRLGVTQPFASTSELFVRTREPARNLQLRDGGAVVASVHLR